MRGDGGFVKQERHFGCAEPSESLGSVWLEEWKSRRWKIFSFSLCIWLEGWKSGRVVNSFLFSWREKENDGKYNLYKLTIIHLLYNR